MKIQMRIKNLKSKEPPHHSRHGKALKKEPFATVTVPLENHEVSIMAHLPSERPVDSKTSLRFQMF